MPYRPPFTITSRLIDLVSRISEELGRWAVAESGISPRLRRENRIRSIHASLAIENNTLSLEQVSAIIQGQRVMGHPREIQEVKNALAAYDLLATLEPHSQSDLLKAHAALLMGLSDDAGRFRTRGVGVYQGERLVHMAPPADRVPQLVQELFAWLAETDFHPLLVSAAVHYEIEFIHPFSDGNGRIGRLWQTVVLTKWKPQLAFLPVESMVHDRQTAYYESLAAADHQADVAPFAEFILQAILDSMVSSPSTAQVSDQVSDQVKSLLRCLEPGVSVTAAELMRRLNLRHKATFRRNYLHPALAAELIEMTAPLSPRSPTQRYRRKPSCA
jgi:Fic family protein